MGNETKHDATLIGGVSACLVSKYVTPEQCLWRVLITLARQVSEWKRIIVTRQQIPQMCAVGCIMLLLSPIAVERENEEQLAHAFFRC